jgi:hypothetical protein
VRLSEANEELLTGALRTAWKLRVEKNESVGKKRSPAGKKKTRKAAD